MAKMNVSTAASKGDSCKWCHYSPFRRTVHLLDMLEHGSGIDDLRRHLLAEFRDRQDEASGFYAAEIRSVESVRQFWGNWRNWQANKISSIGIARLADWLTLPAPKEIADMVDNPPF